MKISYVYTDFHYVYAIPHAHGAIWKERLTLAAETKWEKHGLSKLKLLEAVQSPKSVAVTHWRGHQKESAEVMKRNNKADGIAKRVVLEPVTQQPSLIPRRPDPFNYSPINTKELKPENRASTEIQKTTGS